MKETKSAPPDGRGVFCYNSDVQMNGKIGIYDSGLGGLTVMRELACMLPDYDYVFFGDEKNLPFGSKEIDELKSITEKALRYLFETKNCTLVVIACNTVSSTLFGYLHEWVKKTYPGRHLLGIVQATVDSLPQNDKYVILGTPRTIRSLVYPESIHARFTDAEISQIELPLLASYIEHGGEVDTYLDAMYQAREKKIDGATCVFACTHYGLVEETIKKVFDECRDFVRQELIIADYVKDYIAKNYLQDTFLQEGKMEITVSKANPIFNNFSKEWFPQVAVTLVEV